MTSRLATRLALASLLVLAVLDTTTASNFSDWGPPANLGPVVNSEFGDDGPTMSKDGLSLYFYSTRPGFGGEDIWVCQRATVDDPWGAPMNLGSTINTAGNERAPALSRDGHLLFFGSDRPGGQGGLDLWVSWRAHTKDDFAWQEPVNLGALINTASNDTGPTYFENDDQGIPQLYFVSNRPGGFGLADVYRSELGVDGVWGAAVHVPELSSPQLDAHPSIRPDGLEIFFSSGRPGGSGGTDVWTSTRKSTLDPWSPPVNLGPVVNTAFADGTAGISPDRLTLIFFSNRPGGFGGDDLYVTTRSRIAASEGSN